MKIDVITRHFIINYGSLLQAIATQEVIKKLGYECEIIDYIPENENYRNIDKTIKKNKKYYNKNLLKKYFYLLLRKPESYISGIKFEKQRKKYLNLSRLYRNLNELSESMPKADVYLTGSDQVWGPRADGKYDEAYFLSFVNSKNKKISYAASFGRKKIDEKYMHNLQFFLKQYKYISVREESACSILEKNNIKATRVLDPTLLLDKEYWSQYFEKTKQKRKYILIYQIHNNPLLGWYAKQVAKYYKLELVRISPMLHQIFRQGKFIFCPSIGQFLSYINDAECVITDSFHGTVFSINFQKKFVEILPEITSTRSQDILKQLNLTNRILTEKNDFQLAMKEIEYEKTNVILNKIKNISIDILKKMIVE